jgi:hypothetical protein
MPLLPTNMHLASDRLEAEVVLIDNHGFARDPGPKSSCAKLEFERGRPADLAGLNQEGVKRVNLVCAED